MATFTEHEDLCGKSIAFQCNKISWVYQADATYYTHNTTTQKDNNECTQCILYNVFKHVISCKSQQHDEVGTTFIPM